MSSQRVWPTATRRLPSRFEPGPIRTGEEWRKAKPHVLCIDCVRSLFSSVNSTDKRPFYGRVPGSLLTFSFSMWHYATLHALYALWPPHYALCQSCVEIRTAHYALRLGHYALFWPFSHSRRFTTHVTHHRLHRNVHADYASPHYDNRGRAFFVHWNTWLSLQGTELTFVITLHHPRCWPMVLKQKKERMKISRPVDLF